MHGIMDYLPLLLLLGIVTPSVHGFHHVQSVKTDSTSIFHSSRPQTAAPVLVSITSTLKMMVSRSAKVRTATVTVYTSLSPGSVGIIQSSDTSMNRTHAVDSSNGLNATLIVDSKNTSYGLNATLTVDSNTTVLSRNNISHGSSPSPGVSLTGIASHFSIFDLFSFLWLKGKVSPTQTSGHVQSVSSLVSPITHISGHVKSFSSLVSPTTHSFSSSKSTITQSEPSPTTIPITTPEEDLDSFVMDQPNARPDYGLLQLHRPGETKNNKSIGNVRGKGKGEMVEGTSLGSLPPCSPLAQTLMNLLPQSKTYDRTVFDELPAGLPVLVFRYRPSASVLGTSRRHDQDQDRDHQQQQHQFKVHFTLDMKDALKANGVEGIHILPLNLLNLHQHTVVQFTLYPIDPTTSANATSNTTHSSNTLSNSNTTIALPTLIHEIHDQLMNPASPLRTGSRLGQHLDPSVFGLDWIQPITNDVLTDFRSGFGSGFAFGGGSGMGSFQGDESGSGITLMSAEEEGSLRLQLFLAHCLLYTAVILVLGVGYLRYVDRIHLEELEQAQMEPVGKGEGVERKGEVKAEREVLGEGDERGWCSTWTVEGSDGLFDDLFDFSSLLTDRSRRSRKRSWSGVQEFDNKYCEVTVMMKPQF